MIYPPNDQYLTALNVRQLNVVTSDKYPMMIIAGAGSGKTKTLVSKITYLIDREDVDPYNILALTFTNKAADEMKERIEQICPSAKRLTIGTFHSCFMRILQIECEKIGFEKNFTIYDTSDSKALLKRIVKDLKFDIKVYEPSLLLCRISFLKSRLITPEKYLESEFLQQDKTRLPSFEKIFAAYVRECKKNNVMDFDDLLLNIYFLFKNNPEILEKYQSRYNYIFIDEFQDTNVLQNAIVKMLVGTRNNLCVVGDDAQSIYGFRGASLANVLNFQKDYEGANIFKLEQNYRSTKKIIDGANSVIDKNRFQIKKRIWTDNEAGENIYLVKTLTDGEEAKNVANTINYYVKGLDKKCKYSDFAVLYRMNNQSGAFENELRAQKIPYKIVGNISFYQRKEIKNFLAYLRVFVNKDDEESLLRTINFPKRGIGQQSIDRICEVAKKNSLSLWALLKRSADFFEKRFSNLIQNYVELIEYGTTLAQNKDASEVAKTLFHLIGDKGFQEEKESENIKNLLFNIDEFVNSNEDKSLLNYLNSISLVASEFEEESSNDDCVTLMTVHSAKGLEFNNVFIVGAEEKIFPAEAALLAGQIEDERRLFYVAMTRAKQRLFISYTTNRFLYGNFTSSKPSRFVEEIDTGCLEISSVKKNPLGYNLGKMYKSSFSNLEYKRRKFELNSEVFHPLFKKYGHVKKLREVNEQTIVDIEFEDEQVVSINENVLTLFNS